MTGFRSKKAMSAGAYYASKLNLSWREQLHNRYVSAVSKYGNGAWNDIVSDCMDFMQFHFPGKYSTLRWINGGLEPVFDEPKYETIWKIQYEN